MEAKARGGNSVSRARKTLPRGCGRSQPEEGHSDYIQDGDPLVSVLPGECLGLFELNISIYTQRNDKRVT